MLWSIVPVLHAMLRSIVPVVGVFVSTCCQCVNILTVLLLVMAKYIYGTLFNVKTFTIINNNNNNNRGVYYATHT